MMSEDRMGACVQGLVESAEALGPLVAVYRKQLATGPDLPVEIAEALEKGGLTKLWLPRALGGSELAPRDYIRVIEAIARHDGAVGWCASIASTGSRVAGMIPMEAGRALFIANGSVSGSLNPSGTATAERGGWRIRGRWSWGSFIHYSGVTLAMCVEQENGSARYASGGVPVLRAALLPTQAVRILYDWDGGGLRSSGSHDLVIDDLWIPDDYSFALPGYIAKSHHSDALYSLPFITTFTVGTVPVPLGIARGAIDALLALAADKVPAGVSLTLSEHTRIQKDVANAEALLGAARAFVFETVGELWKATLGGGIPTLSQRARVRMACWNAGQASKHVVGLMYAAAGGTAAREDAPFAGQLRDVHAILQHAAFSDRHMETAGRILLGLDREIARF